MNLTPEYSLDNLKQKLTALEQEQFTGELEINSNNLKFKFYFCLGRVIWADGGIHPHRSWKRLVTKYCCPIELNREDIALADRVKCSNYRLLTILLESDRITNTQFSQIIRDKIDEVLFDVIQLAQTSKITLSCQPTSGELLLSSGLKVSLTLVNLQQALRKTLIIWQEWCDRGLEKTSPNLAPKIPDKARLAAEVSPKVYENSLGLIDGNRTLRDLAPIVAKDFLALTVSLLPYLRNKLFALAEIEDIAKTAMLNNFSQPRSSQHSLSSAKQSDITIACIDDSSQALGIMEEILKRAGFNFIGIQDPLRVIPKLLLSNPDLIFLDIGMPYMNGYEICAQLRRVPELERIPIVMLTGKDGVVDRVRAKMAGADDFLAKPIKAARILNIVMKFVPI